MRPLYRGIEDRFDEGCYGQSEGEPTSAEPEKNFAPAARSPHCGRGLLNNANVGDLCRVQGLVNSGLIKALLEILVIGLL